MLAAVLTLGSCSQGSGWRAEDLVVVVATADPGVQRAAGDLSRLVEASTGVAPPITDGVEGLRHAHPLLIGQGPWECPDLPEDAYQVSQVAFEGRAALRFCGGGPLGTQYGVY